MNKTLKILFIFLFFIIKKINEPKNFDFDNNLIQYYYPVNYPVILIVKILRYIMNAKKW